MIPVARRDPQLAIVDVWRDHLLVAPLAVLLADEVNESVVDVGSMGKKKNNFQGSAHGKNTAPALAPTCDGLSSQLLPGTASTP